MHRTLALALALALPVTASAKKEGCDVAKVEEDAFAGTKTLTYTTPSMTWMMWGSETKKGSWDGRDIGGAIRDFTVTKAGDTVTLDIDYWRQGAHGVPVVDPGVVVPVKLADGSVMELTTSEKRTGSENAEVMGIVTKIPFRFTLTPEQVQRLGEAPITHVRIAAGGLTQDLVVAKKALEGLTQMFACVAGHG